MEFCRGWLADLMYLGLMKPSSKVAIMVCLCATLCGGLARGATENQGTEVAGTLTKITGVAISPLLGVGAVGAWDWWKAPAEKRAHLPWHARPQFWVPALLLVAAVAAKDVMGTAAPPGLKKPLDVAETVENKVSGLVAAGAFVPIAAMIFHASGDGGTTSTHTGLAGMAVIDLTPLLNILTVPLAVAAFVVVWLLGHVINVLILISPFGAVDAVLKSARTGLMGLLTAVHLIDPWVAAGMSLVIIVIAFFVAGWSLRLTVFGSVYVWDFVTRRRNRFTPAANANWMFAGRKIGRTPVRTYGKLVTTADGKLTFDYRPWMFGAPRTVALPAGKYAVGRGLFYPALLLVDGEDAKQMLVMPPRYKKHEEAVARIYGLGEVRDTGLLKGIKSIWRWFTRDLFGAESKEAAAAAGTA